MSYQVGVDLGTTYSAAAVCRPGGPVELVPLGQRARSVPSTVYAGPDGGFLIGEAAERRALSDPGRVVREFKRRIGDPTPVLVGRDPMPAEELAARFISRLLQDVAAREGAVASRVAITHPAGWGSHKLTSMRAALAEHGLGSALLLSEPQAAAVGYANTERVEAGATVAVYDLGGGTFDAAVVRKTAGGHFELLGTPEGLEQLGGLDFDEAVFTHVRSALGADWQSLDPSDPEVLAAVAGLRRECTAAKEALSHDTEVLISVLLPGLCTQVRLGRGEFEEMIRPAVAETVAALRRALDSAGVTAADLGALLLVGGSSRIPLITQAVSAEFGRSAAVDVDPKGVIAAGAAVVARAAERGSAGPGPASGAAAGAPAGSRAGVPAPESRGPGAGARRGRASGGGAAPARGGSGPAAAAGVGGPAAAAVGGAAHPAAAPAPRSARVRPGGEPGSVEPTDPAAAGSAPAGSAPAGSAPAGHPANGLAGSTSRVDESGPLRPAPRPPKQARPFTATVEEPAGRRRVVIGVAAGALVLVLLGGAVAFGAARIGANQEAGASTPPTAVTAVSPVATAGVPTTPPPSVAVAPPGPVAPPARPRARPPAPRPAAPPPAATTTAPPAEPGTTPPGNGDAGEAPGNAPPAAGAENEGADDGGQGNGDQLNGDQGNGDQQDGGQENGGGQGNGDQGDGDQGDGGGQGNRGQDGGGQQNGSGARESAGAADAPDSGGADSSTVLPVAGSGPGGAAAPPSGETPPTT